MNAIHKYLALLVCVLRADGFVDEREKDLFHTFLDKMGHSSGILDDFGESSYLDVETNLDINATIDEIANGIEPDMLSWMIRDAYYMAKVDGDISKAELDVIQQLLVKCGIPENRLEQIDSWGRKHIEHTERSIELAREAEKLFSR